MNRKELQQMNYEKKHKEVDGVIYKQCSIHKEYLPNDENDWFPCTEEYFHKNKSSPDGLYPYCKICNSKKNSKWSKNNHDKKLGYWRKEYGTPKRRESYRICGKKQRESGYKKEWEQNNKDKMKQYRENRKQHGEHKITKKEWIDCKNYFDSNNELKYYQQIVTNQLTLRKYNESEIMVLTINQLLEEIEELRTELNDFYKSNDEECD